MHRPGPFLVRAADRESHYARQRQLFETLTADLQEYLSRVPTFAVRRDHDCVRVLRTNSSAPLLKIAFDEGTAVIWYERSTGDGSASGGRVLAGYSGTALLVDDNAVARRMGVTEAAKCLLSCATADATVFTHVA